MEAELPKMGDAAHLDTEEVEVDEGLAVVLARFFLVFGGVAPYIPQYLQIMHTKDASGFSTYVCLVIIFSNALRIAYWFGHWFDNALLLQSIIMTVVMLVVLELCLRTGRNNARDNQLQYDESSFWDSPVDRFWKWTNLRSYMEATFSLLLVAILYTTLFSGYDFFIEPIGFAALLVESTLAMPQFAQNYNQGSTNGMNVYMVILWTIGDLVKGFFFFQTSQPIPFQMCAVIQLCVDAALFYQIGTYD